MGRTSSPQAVVVAVAAGVVQIYCWQTVVAVVGKTVQINFRRVVAAAVRTTH